MKLSQSEQWEMVSEAQELYRQRMDVDAQQESELEKSVIKIDAIYKGESDQLTEKRIYMADYGDATATDVAKALLTYRPKAKRGR